MAKAILKDEEQHRRYDAMARVFTKAARVITGMPITCKVVHDQGMTPAPSWTDGRTVTFNAELIGNVSSVDDLIRLTGLFYHELAHCLYTSRHGVMVEKIRSRGMHGAYNMLEDQRIETLLTAKYPSGVAYLVSTFMRFCLMHQSAWESNFPLMHGRYFLPKDVRDEFRARFARQDLIPEFERIIDEYRKLILPLDEDRALQLVTEYHYLLQDMNTDGLTPEDPNGHVGGRPQDVSVGQNVPASEQQEASELSDVMDDVYNDADDDDADSIPSDDDDDTEVDEDSQHGGSKRDDDAEADANDPEDGDASDDDDADGEGTGSGSGSQDGTDDADADADADGGSDGSGMGDGDADDDGMDLQDQSSQSDGAGSGRPDPNAPMSDDALRDMLEDFAKAYESLDEVVDDITKKQRIIVRGDNDISNTLDPGRFYEAPVEPIDISSVRAFSKVLDMLRADADPGWRQRQPSGRINIQRAIQGAPLDDLWDQWDEGNTEASDIECVIIIDRSGSMSNEIDAASRAMWVIKRAMETVNASVTVITFDYATEIVYDRHERASKTKYRRMSATGGTHAREAVIEAVRILTTSTRSNKVFIAITDGAWDPQPGDARSDMTPDGMIAALGSQGVTTALAHIETALGGPSMRAHQCHIAERVSHSADLIPFARKIVAKAMSQKKGR